MQESIELFRQRLAAARDELLAVPPPAEVEPLYPTVERDLMQAREELSALAAACDAANAARATLEESMRQREAAWTTERQALEQEISRLREVGEQPADDAGELQRVQADLNETTTQLLAARQEIALMRKGIDPRAERALRQETLPAVGTVMAFDDKGHKKRMGQILIEAGLLTDLELEEILGQQAEDPHKRLGALVVSRGLTSEQVIATILAAQLRLPFVSLEQDPPAPEALALVNPSLSRLHRCIAWRIEEDRLRVAMENPLDLIAIEDVELASRKRVEPVVSTASDIQQALQRVAQSS